MKILRRVVGQLQENCYIIFDEKTKKAILIDPGDDANSIMVPITKENLSVEGIFITHGHVDHVGAVEEMKEITGALVYAAKSCADELTSNKMSVADIFAPDRDVNIVPDVFLKDGEEVEVMGTTLKAVFTPGHSVGGCCYIVEDAIFSGDTIFNHSIGRTDMAGGDYEQLLKSIEKITALKGDYMIYPGHGFTTNLKEERENNPYFGTAKYDSL